MPIRAVFEPKQYSRALKKPYTACVFPGIPYGTIDQHYFCEGLGKSSWNLSASAAYNGWLEQFENPWWKCWFGASKYSIEVVDVPEPSIYVDG